MDSRIRSVAAAAVVVFLALAGCSQSPKSKLSRDVPALVNGAPITRAEVARAAKALLAQNAVAQPAPPELVKKAKEAAMEQLVTAELLYQEARKHQVKDLDRLVSQRTAQGRARYRSQQEYDEALKSVGMTAKEVETALRKDIVIASFTQRQFGPGTEVPEAECRMFYEQNREKFKRGERVRASQILVQVPEQAAAQVREQASSRAHALLRRVRGGEDFAALANAESAPPTNRNGGDLGVLNRGEAPPAFESAAFALKVGEVSDVVETPLGYHIVKLVQKLPPSTAGFGEVKAQIAEYLRQDRMRRAISEFAGSLRAKAKIEKL